MTYLHRFDFTIKVENNLASDLKVSDTRTKLVEKIQEFIEAIHTEVLEHVYIAPWSYEDKGAPFITKAGEVPETLKDLRRYFYQLRSPTKKSSYRTWTSVFIVSRIDFKQEVISQNDSKMSDWYTDNGCALYKKIPGLGGSFKNGKDARVLRTVCKQRYD